MLLYHHYHYHHYHHYHHLYHHHYLKTEFKNHHHCHHVPDSFGCLGVYSYGPKYQLEVLTKPHL
jgi:hypothetical protein